MADSKVTWPEPWWRPVVRLATFAFGMWLMLHGLGMVWPPLMYLFGGASLLVGWYGLEGQAREERARHERELMRVRLFGGRVREGGRDA